MANLEFLLTRHLTRLTQLQLRAKKYLSNLSLLRLFGFAVFLFSLVISYYYRSSSPFISFFPIPFFFLFMASIHIYKKWDSFLQKLDSTLDFNRREKLRANIDIKSLHRSDPILPEEIQKKHFWKDLDLFGKFGLYSYLDTTITNSGNQKFISQLLQTTKNNISTIQFRQKNISFFINKRAFTKKLLRVFFASSESAGYSKLQRGPYPDDNFYLEKFELLFQATRYFSLFFWIALFFIFLIEANSLYGVLFVLSLLFYTTRIREKTKALKKYEAYFSKISKLNPVFPLLASLSLYDDNGKEFDSLDRSSLKNLQSDLNKVLFFFSLREAPLLNFLLNLFFQYDSWLLDRTRSFSLKWKISLELLLEKLDYVDSILPFVNFHFHQPQTFFPEIDNNLSSISATKIGHPLIAHKNRIYNPLEEVNFGSVTLITGSNMSGKTTYLRTIGINCLLAICGSPVPAENFKLPPLQILSSIKNEDSLDEGISFFYAEVRKISYILTSSKTSSLPSLILIDEVLKGTNTRERVIATEKILKELSTYNAFSFITTHDLELAKKHKQKKWKLKHFEEQVKDNKMSFDYKIRDGVVNSSNALRILSIEHPEIIFVDD